MLWTLSLSTHARANLAGTMDRVCNDHEPVIITRNGDQSVVILAGRFPGAGRNSYLLRSPANAKRLFKSIEQLEAGRGQARSWPNEINFFPMMHGKIICSGKNKTAAWLIELTS